MRYGYIPPRRLSCWLSRDESLVARRRLRDEGSIYQRGDGRWVGALDLGHIDGKRVRRTVTAATLRELRPKFAALKDSVGAGVDDEDITVGRWMEKWLTDVAAKRNRASTVRTYEGYTSRWIVPQIGRVRLSRLRPDHIRGLLRAMEDAGRSDATRRQVLAIVRRALKVAEQDRLIAWNPALVVDAPAVGKGSHGRFTLGEAKAILYACELEDGTTLSRWICALLAGLRQGEALGLTWEAVDLDNGLIHVRQAVQQVKGHGVQVVELKSRAAYRAVPMLSPVREALKREPSREGFVWGGAHPTAPRRDWQAWKDFLASIDGVPDRPLHAARATCASLLRDAGVPESTIADILGHSQVAVTQKHYLHGDEESRRAAMERLDAFLVLSPPDD